jgi:hypothetical protein
MRHSRLFPLLLISTIANLFHISREFGLHQRTTEIIVVLGTMWIRGDHSVRPCGHHFAKWPTWEDNAFYGIYTKSSTQDLAIMVISKHSYLLLGWNCLMELAVCMGKVIKDVDGWAWHNAEGSVCYHNESRLGTSSIHSLFESSYREGSSSGSTLDQIKALHTNYEKSDVNPFPKFLSRQYSYLYSRLIWYCKISDSMSQNSRANKHYRRELDVLVRTP